MIEYTGLEKAILGVANVWHPDGERVERIIYSGEKIVQIFKKRDKMTYEEAIEFIEFNTDGGYLGKSTPIIVWSIEDLD